MRRTTATALTAAVFFGAQAGAFAATAQATSPSATTAKSTLQNARADRTALNAYATYLQTLAANKLAGKQAEAAFAGQTSTTCPEALQQIGDMPSVPAAWTPVLTSIGEEIGADATIEFTDIAVAPFQKLAATLSTLRWSGGTPANTVKRFLAAENTILALQPSNLCGDVEEAIPEQGSQTMTEPPATQLFLAGYQTDSATVDTRMSAFLKLLDGFETASDQTVATRINTLAKRVTTISSTTIASGTAALQTALGISADLS